MTTSASSVPSDALPVEPMSFDTARDERAYFLQCGFRVKRKRGKGSDNVEVEIDNPRTKTLFMIFESLGELKVWWPGIVARAINEGALLDRLLAHFSAAPERERRMMKEWAITPDDNACAWDSSARGLLSSVSCYRHDTLPAGWESVGLRLAAGNTLFLNHRSEAGSRFTEIERVERIEQKQKVKQVAKWLKASLGEASPRSSGLVRGRL